MGKLLKRVLIIMLVVILAGVAYTLYVWYQPERDVKDENAIAITAQTIFDAYGKDEKAANTLYLNKAVAVSGEVVSAKPNQEGKMVLMLRTTDAMFGVQCTMKENVVAKEGEQVIVKGICTGFLMDVVLIDCYIEK